MKFLFSEFIPDYNQYRFPYQIWAVKEKKDNLAQIYYNGWLPFRSKKDLFYMARSTRVRLNKFALSSENRRILRKVEGLNFSVQPIEQFIYTPEMQKLCKNFADKKFGKGMMPTAAIRKMFTNANTTHVFSFKTESKVGLSEKSPTLNPIGYAAAVIHDHFLHYAHPFSDLKHDNPNLGMGMMLKAILWAQEQHKQFAYLGTCYTKSSLYKTQFAGFEFFNGLRWSDDLEELKYLINRKDDGYLMQDREYKRHFLKEKMFDNSGIKVSFK